MPNQNPPSNPNHFRLLRFIAAFVSVFVLIGLAIFIPYSIRKSAPVTDANTPQAVSTIPLKIDAAKVPVSASVPLQAVVPEATISAQVTLPSTPVASNPIVSEPVQPSSVSAEPVPIHVPILLYHYVRDTVYSRDIVRYEMNATPAIFEDQLKGLIDAGYHFVTLAEVAAALGGVGALPEKPIVLTFDDGIVDVYTNVLPLLKRYQVRITAYLVPALLDHKQYLTTDMAKELAQSGWVEIGSHSSHHLKLKTLSVEKAKSEIADSKAALEKLLGVSVNTFAYPFGLYNEVDPKLVKEAGYTSAATMIWTVARNSSDPFQLPRLNIGERSGKELVAFLKGFK